MIPCIDETQLVKLHLNNIIKGDHSKEEFNQSVKLLRNYAIDNKELIIVIIKSLSSVNWSELSSRTTKVLLKLLLEFLIEHPIGIQIGLECLVKSIKNLELESKSTLERVIGVIVKISSISPVLVVKLPDILRENIPYVNRSKKEYLVYSQFLICIPDHIPKITQNIFEIITYMLIQLDSELSRENLERDNDILLYMKEHNLDLSSIRENQSRKNELSYFLIYDTLDELIAFFIDYFLKYSEYESYDSLFKLLKTSLDKVLSCQGLISIHYIWYYLSCKDKSFLSNTLSYFYKNLININVCIHTRHLSAIHLGGYLSRFKSLSYDTFKYYVTKLAEFVLNYMTNMTLSHHLELIILYKTHRIYYVVCQTLFYCIAFQNKLKSESESDEWHKFLCSLSLERIILSPLNPLALISPNVADAIAEVGSQHQVFFAYSIISRNKRISNNIGKLGNAKDEVNVLNLESSCNFPYDPYLLSSIKSYIEQNYNYW